MLAGNPAAIYCFFAGQAAIEFIRALWADGYRGPIYAPGFLTEGIVLNDLEEQEVSKIYTALNYSPDLDNSANRTFASAYRKLYTATPTTYAVASYDAAQVLDSAIRLAGPSPTPQSVNLALSRIGQVASPRGDWQFNQPRTPQQRWYLRRVQRDGPVLANVARRRARDARLAGRRFAPPGMRPQTHRLHPAGAEHFVPASSGSRRWRAQATCVAAVGGPRPARPKARAVDSLCRSWTYVRDLPDVAGNNPEIGAAAGLRLGRSGGSEFGDAALHAAAALLELGKLDRDGQVPGRGELVRPARSPRR